MRVLAVALTMATLLASAQAQTVDEQLTVALSKKGLKGALRLADELKTSPDPRAKHLQTFARFVRGYLANRKKVKGIHLVACELFTEGRQGYAEFAKAAEPKPSAGAAMQPYYEALAKKDKKFFKAWSQGFLDLRVVSPAVYGGSWVGTDKKVRLFTIDPALSRVATDTVRTLTLSPKDKFKRPEFGTTVEFLLADPVKGTDQIVCSAETSTPKPTAAKLIRRLESLQTNKKVKLSGGTTVAWSLLLGFLADAGPRSWGGFKESHWIDVYHRLWPHTQGGLGVLRGFPSKARILRRIQSGERKIDLRRGDPEAALIHLSYLALMYLAEGDSERVRGNILRLERYAQSLGAFQKERAIAYAEILRSFDTFGRKRKRTLSLSSVEPAHLGRELLSSVFVYAMGPWHPPKLRKAAQAWLKKRMR